MPYCPDSSLPVAEGKLAGIDYLHCKGCGICAQVCPFWGHHGKGGWRGMNYNERLSGNEAIAFAMKQIDPDVMAAFPITPSTEIPQYFAQYVANGEVNTEFVPVESEHSSMSACIGAEAAGARR